MIILLQLMIPSGVLLVQNFRMINTFLGCLIRESALMLPYWGSAFGVLLLRQTFREVPIELEEAARIDGANLYQVIRHVYVTNAIPAYLAFALVSVSSHWNEFLWPFIITRSARNQAADGRPEQADQNDRSRRLLRTADGRDA